jgi:hypothetical protein
MSITALCAVQLVPIKYLADHHHFSFARHKQTNHHFQVSNEGVVRVLGAFFEPIHSTNRREMPT